MPPTQKKKVETLAAENEWIEAEKHLFGKPYTDYDFKQLSTKQAQTKLTGLKNEQEQLGKKINKKSDGNV